MFSIDGLVSGLDTSSIIEGLLSIQQRQLDRFEARKQEIQIRQAAFEGIEANVTALQGAAAQLGSFTNDLFSIFNAQSSDETIAAAAADSDAVPGTYQFTVTQLATAEQIGSQSYVSSGSEITDGDIVIQVGNRDAVTVSVTTENNTLSGLAEAINASSDDVTASVVNDGSGFRLLLASKHTGADNQINITNNTKVGTGRIDFTGTPVQAAQDSQVQLGSGAGAITISRPDNTVEDVIPGLTLNLLSADAGKEISVSVSRDSAPAREAIEGFVTAFNNVMSYIDEQTRYDTDTDQAGLLLGNNSTNSIRDQLRGELARTIANVSTEANRLSSIGISFDDNGQLQIDSGKLDTALAGNLEGISISDVRNLFALNGQPDSPGISFISGTNDTQISSSPWEVNITKAAERASITADNTVATSVVIDSSNDAFSIEVDGVDSGTLSLTSGTYTQSELAEHLESVINQASALGGRDVTVTVNNDLISIESVIYGTQSEVGSVGGTAAATLGFSGTEYDRGVDVSGYFIVDGETENATGNGRVLSGISGNANTDGLQLQVTLTPSQVSGTHTSNLTVSRGFASSMELLIDNLLDSDTGRFSQTIEGFDDQIESVESSVARLNAVFESRQQQLINEFVGIETTINSLQTTSAFLTSQLGSASLLANR